MTQLTTKTDWLISETSFLPASSNPSLVYLAQLSSGSRRTMRQSLNVMAGILSQEQCTHENFPWWLLRYQHTSALRSHLQESYSPATTNKMLSALKRVLLECRRLGLMTGDDYTTATDLKIVKSQRLPSGRALTAGEIAALMRVCCEDTSPKGYRDAAMLALLMCGLRRSEVAAVELKDFEPATGAITVRAGKGQKDRLTYLPSGGVAAVADWVNVRGDVAGYLLNPINKGKVINRDQGINAQTVLDVLMVRAEEAGVRDVSPHDFRRTFISNLLDLGADIATVQRLAGHSSPDTTSRYDRRGEATKQRAVSLLHLPYQRG